MEPVTVANGMIGLASAPNPSSTGTSAVELSEVNSFSAVTTNGDIVLALGGSVDSTATNVTAGGTGNVSVTSAANFLTIQDITANGATPPGGTTIGGNVDVTTTNSNGSLLEYPSNAGIVSGQNVTLMSALPIGSYSSPFLTNATSALQADATATSPSSAAIYVNNASDLTAVGASTYSGSVIINYNGSGRTYSGLLSFSNTVLSATGGAVVTFANTDDNGGSEDNVQLMGTINATSISALGQIPPKHTSTMVKGQTVMLSAGNGIFTPATSTNGSGSPPTPIDINVTGLDATTNTGDIFIQNTSSTPSQYQGQVKFTPNASGDTMALPTSSNTTWAALGYAAGDMIVVSGAGAAADNGAFAIASVSGSTLTLLQSNALTAETDPNVTVYDTLPVSASTSNGNIDLISPGNMSLVLTGISTNPNGTVTLNAGGIIFDASSNSAAVSGGMLDLTASQVGTSGNPLQTSVASLTVSGPSGGSLRALYLSNNTALTVTSVNSAGDVSISAMGNLALEGSLSGSNVNLTATAGALTATTTATSNGTTTITAQQTLTISAEQIGDSPVYSPGGTAYAVTNFLRTDAPTINATANYGGIYISNDDTNASGPVPLLLTAAAVGPTFHGAATNNIEIYSAGSIFIEPQKSPVTDLGGKQPVGVFNPGGLATLEAGETESATGGNTTTTTNANNLPFAVCDAFAIVSDLDTRLLSVGLAVSGTGIPPDVTIAGLNPTGSSSDGEIVLSKAATATKKGVHLTFFGTSQIVRHLTGNTTGLTATLYYDVETGTYNIPANVGLRIVKNNQEIVVTPPAGGGGNSALVLTRSALQAKDNADKNGMPLKYSASSIVIANLGGTLTLRNSLELTAKEGSIVFLNQTDTIEVTGTNSSITINAGGASSSTAVAALGNLKAGGKITVNAVGNITIGNLTPGPGGASVTADSGSIFSSSGDQLSGPDYHPHTPKNPAPVTTNVPLAQLYLTEVVAAADAASAQAAADQTTANALQRELNSIRTAVVNDRQMLQQDVQVTNTDNGKVKTKESRVINLTSDVAAISIAEGVAWTAAAVLCTLSAYAGEAASVVIQVPFVGPVTLGTTYAINLLGNAFNFIAAGLCVGAASVQYDLNRDSNQLITEEATLAADQSAQDKVTAQLNADMNVRTAVTAAYNVAEQAATSAEKAAATLVSTQVVNAQANAIVAVVASATPPAATALGKKSDQRRSSAMTVSAPITVGSTGGGTVKVAGKLVARSASIGVGPSSTGPETFNITPSATTPITVTGGKGMDTLNFNADGLGVTISGHTIKAGTRAPVTFTNIEVVHVIDAAGGASFTRTYPRRTPSTTWRRFL
jgi:hypothetical protein